LEALADSVERIGRRSYYGRDWSLHHHVRGLIAKRNGDLALAEDELRKAQWRIGDGWTRSMTELGVVQLQRGKSAEALSSFRNAYATRPDAMGRYQPRSEVDYYMAQAFRQAGDARQRGCLCRLCSPSLGVGGSRSEAAFTLNDHSRVIRCPLCYFLTS
jgi:hypothetical protein